MVVAQQANIHQYDGTGTVLDEEGDPLYGFYWEILGFDNLPLTDMMGPYGSRGEAESACQRAYDDGDY